jgi:Fe-S oxidoreductase/nitrate reductase gamma subunit
MSAQASETPRADSLKIGFAKQFRNLNLLLKHLADFLRNAVLQTRIYNKPYAGIMHGLLFWGVTIQVIGTVINLMQMQLFIPFIELAFPRQGLYLAFELVMDLAGIAILLGVSMAAFRRYILRPGTLESHWDDLYALLLLALIPLAGFTLEATRLLSAKPAWAVWSPVGALLASWLGALGLTAERAAGLHGVLFWTHVALGLALLASIPYTKLRHLVNTPLNILLRRRDQPGVPEKIDNIEEAEVLGVGDIREFKPRQLLSFDACVRCGRCEEICPAALSGADYSPRQLIQSLRQVLQNTLVYPETSGGSVNSEKYQLLEALSGQSPWSCTTCGACLERCPAFISPVEEIIDLRRYQALTTGKLPKNAADTLRNLERQGNPWGLPPEERIAWTDGLGLRELAPGDETDVLLYLGCACAFDTRNRKAASAFVRLLQYAEVDFGILGMDETCCGDMARRLGHEYLFQVSVEQLNETLKAVKFNRIVTQCPHCYNSLKNEYPQLGVIYPVQHYTQYLSEISPEGLKTTSNGNGLHSAATYHDSCYLGRYNQIYLQPRQLLKQAQIELLEFDRRAEQSFCCGGGGGQVFMESEAEFRINHLRLEEAMQAQVGVVATGCPYCLLMFDDAIRSKGVGDVIQVFDIAEILENRFLRSTKEEVIS